MSRSKPNRRRPSPSLVISILALFIALGGSAYAASKVGTKDIKKNAVTAIKIKKGAVTTAKIKDNAVTGAKLDEGTLAKVPNALHADSATNADNAVNAANFKRFGTTGLVTRSHNQEELIPVADGPGPFSFQGLCVDTDGGGGYAVYATIRSSEAGAFVFSDGGVGDTSNGKIPADTDVEISPTVTPPMAPPSDIIK